MDALVAHSFDNVTYTAGFAVPGEEQLKTAAGLQEVRYFFAEDAGRAAALAQATNAILRDMGYSAAVEVRDRVQVRAPRGVDQ